MEKATVQENFGTWIEMTIREFIDTSPENTLCNKENDRAWADPLVGFSNGADPLYQEFKRHIGTFYWTPMEIFKKTFPSTNATPHQLTVISWILPQTEKTKQMSRKEAVYPSENWARSRIFGEKGNVKLRRHIVETLKTAGHRAVAPQLDPGWEERASTQYGDASTWSERHAAYAAGLGTFGLCDGLITAKGKAMRCGSVVAEIKIPATPRPYADHREYCLFHRNGTCGQCIERCPVKALSKKGHDKAKCRHHIFEVTPKYVRSHFHFDGYACGLCQVGVPCESKIPTPADLE
jgi:epoxyqueuosine reductase QueG